VARLGEARRGWAWLGSSWHGLARQAWQGVARKAVAKPGMAGLARPVEARRDLALSAKKHFALRLCDQYYNVETEAPMMALLGEPKAPS